jgi:hypothetical protein
MAVAVRQGRSREDNNLAFVKRSRDMDLKLILKLMSTLGRMRKHERWTRAQLER